MDLNIFLSGGGTRLAAHLGAIQDIEQRGGRAVHWAGSSAGALMAAVLASGYDHQQAIKLLMGTDFRQFLDFRPTGVLRRYGLYAGKRLEKWLDTALEHRRFADLNTPLSVVALDIESGKPFIFSKKTTPNAPLSLAVRCSVSIPGIFAIRRHDGRILIDGALTNIDPPQLFQGRPHPCVTIRLVREPGNQWSKASRFGLANYITQVASLLLDAVDRTRVVQTQWKNTLLIDTAHYSSINFEMSTEDKHALYRMGQEQARQYLDLEAIASEHLAAQQTQPEPAVS